MSSYSDQLAVIMTLQSAIKTNMGVDLHVTAYPDKLAWRVAFFSPQGWGYHFDLIKMDLMMEFAALYDLALKKITDGLIALEKAETGTITVSAGESMKQPSSWMPNQYAYPEKSKQPQPEVKSMADLYAHYERPVKASKGESVASAWSEYSKSISSIPWSYTTTTL